MWLSLITILMRNIMIMFCTCLTTWNYVIHLFRFLIDPFPLLFFYYTSIFNGTRLWVKCDLITEPSKFCTRVGKRFSVFDTDINNNIAALDRLNIVSKEYLNFLYAIENKSLQVICKHLYQHRHDIRTAVLLALWRQHN